MLYECVLINNIWKSIAAVLTCKIDWKILVLGYTTISKTTSFRMLLFTIVMKTIHNIWLENSEKPEVYRIADFKSKIAANITRYADIFKFQKIDRIAYSLGKVVNAMIQNI